MPINFQVGTRMGGRPSHESCTLSPRTGYFPVSGTRRRTDRPLLHSRQRGVPSIPLAHLLRPLERGPAVSRRLFHVRLYAHFRRREQVEYGSSSPR